MFSFFFAFSAVEHVIFIYLFIYKLFFHGLDLEIQCCCCCCNGIFFLLLLLFTDAYSLTSLSFASSLFIKFCLFVHSCTTNIFFHINLLFLSIYLTCYLNVSRKCVSDLGIGALQYIGKIQKKEMVDRDHSECAIEKRERERERQMKSKMKDRMRVKNRKKQLSFNNIMSLRGVPFLYSHTESTNYNRDNHSIPFQLP